MNRATLTSTMNKPRAYYLPAVPNGHEVSPDKAGHYYVGIAVEGEPGYYVTDWDYGTDRELAAQCLAELNERMGVSEKEAARIVLSSMFPRRRNSFSNPSRGMR